ncbi:ABC transporter substrate-binding protein [Pelomonas sp. Root1444]|uniref:ABC transporter substrate-binding protein n=1 Tax=Pelomonas sp. Root1444 TaxID=1736464 RepID=UPI0009EB31B8|nr:ABC transporter substrate-binding protein [Pelomonas sp. Root1444]
MRRLLAAIAAALTLPAPPAAAAPASVLQRVQASGELRVCIWPDYYGISLRNPRTGQLSGIDIDLSAAFAADLKVAPRYVESSFATVVEDLVQDRCDVAMFAVGMTSQRARQLRFSRPYLESDIYAVTTHSSHVVQRWQDLDKPGVRIAVQAGTFMEPVMAGALKRATLVVVRPPDTRERELEAGRVDAFMTDYPYSRRLLDNADWARLVAPPAPFYVMPYAYAVRPGDAAWLGHVDDFVARIQRDGRLRAAAERHGLGAIVRNR